ncbi:MAG: NTP transferase domain-containing protein [Phycisphaerae bacterium]
MDQVSSPSPSTQSTPAPLGRVVQLGAAAVSKSKALGLHGGIRADAPVLVVLAAGIGKRFGQAPKCIQDVCGRPLARHSIDNFRSFSDSPVVCVIGYRHEEVSRALGEDVVYVLSSNAVGGTAMAAYEACGAPGLMEADPLLVITMGDRIIPTAVFRQLCDAHRGGPKEAGLTFLTALYEPDRLRGKGRIIRDGDGRVIGIVEEKDILAEPDPARRATLLASNEGNCPLYAIRARTLVQHLRDVTNANSQGQYYLTDIVQSIRRDGGDIRTVATTPGDNEYRVLCADVTRPADLAALAGVLQKGSRYTPAPP